MKGKRYIKIGILYLMAILMAGYSITAYATEMQGTPIPTENPQPQETEVTPEETPEPITEEDDEQTPEETPAPTAEAEEELASEETATPTAETTEEKQSEGDGEQTEEASPAPTADIQATPSSSSTPTADIENGTETGSEEEEELLSADGSFYYLQGTMREGGNCFVSDIVIYPTGKDGFTYIRQGEEGEFEESLVIHEDAIDGVITVQFYDGGRMTEPIELTYSRDTKAPCIEAVSSEKKVLAENVILLATPQLYVYAEDEEVWSEDGDKISGSGIDVVYCRYDGIENCYEPEGDKAVITLPDSFYGTVEIWCKDKAGNESEVYSAVYLTDVTKPQVNVSTRLTVPELAYDELLIEITDPGNINTGIQSVEYTLNGEQYTPEITVSSKEIVKQEEPTDEEVEEAEKAEAEETDGDEPVVVTISSFRLQITEETSELMLSVRDYAGNLQQCSYLITKEPEPEAYQIQMPNQLFLTIDPYQLMGEEQIVSEGNYIKNLNEFPVTIKISAFEYTVKKDNFPEEVTPCELNLCVTDEEPVKLNEGVSNDVLEFKLEPQEQRDIRFYGSLKTGTEHLWRAGDINIKFVCVFEKQRDLIVEKVIEKAVE